MTELVIEFLWVPSNLGGHHAEPYVDMRLQIRWQAHIEESFRRARDVMCNQLRFDAKSGCGMATFFFVAKDPVPSEWLKPGELIELLNGFRVLAVGRIVDIDFNA